MLRLGSMIMLFTLLACIELQAQPSDHERLSPPAEFIRNVGQWDASVRYGMLVPRGAALLTRDGVSIFSRSTSLLDGRDLPRESPAEKGGPYYDVRRISFVNPSSRMSIRPTDTSDAVSHFYRGTDREKWYEHVSNHARITYEDVWPGVDAVMENSPRGPRMVFMAETQERLKQCTRLVEEPEHPGGRVLQPPQGIGIKLSGWTRRKSGNRMD
jgi:hypothetical protein